MPSRERQPIHFEYVLSLRPWDFPEVNGRLAGTVRCEDALAEFLNKSNPIDATRLSTRGT
jgi:hypothetical protein